MLRHLQTHLYIQISPDWLSVRDVKRGKTIAEPAQIAISGDAKKVVLGTGSGAQLAVATSPGAILIKPFAHPRSLISDFTSAKCLLADFVQRMMYSGWFSFAPLMIVHPLGNPDGGYTGVEIRALHELALAVRATKVYLWQGRDLTDQEVISLQFPADGKQLLN